MKPYDQGPGSPYKFLSGALWPQLDDEDPLLRRWDMAYREATGRTVAHRPSRDAPLEFIAPEGADPLGGSAVRPLIAITCVPAMHNRHRPPTLATVWETSLGPLFIAELAGRLMNPGEVPGDAFDPPAAVRNWKTVYSPREPDVQTKGWAPVPITTVRLLLTDDVPAKLWVKCVDHGPAAVDRAKLDKEYTEYLESARQGDTPGGCVLRLDSVAALFSD